MHKITIALRNLGNYTLMIGSFTINKGEMANADTLRMSEFNAVAFDRDNFDLRISTSSVPTSEYRNMSISESFTAEIWRGFAGKTPNDFGGLISMLDSLLLEEENENEIERKVFGAVFSNKHNPLCTDEHAIYHGETNNIFSDCVNFSMVREKDKAKSEQFVGDSPIGMLSKLEFTNASGTEFVIKSDATLSTQKALKNATKEFMETGILSKETNELLEQNGIPSFHFDEQYKCFLRSLDKKTDLFLRKGLFLKTKEESNKIKEATKSVIDDLL